MATLQVTRLSAAEITLGKFAAAWGTALVFLALTVPLVAYAMTQRGVPFGRVLVVVLVIALLLGTVCAVSLFLSAALARTTTSGVLAYVAVFALTVGTLLDAAPRLPDGTERQGDVRVSAADLDPLGQIGRIVRNLRVEPGTPPVAAREQPPAVWPTGLAVDVLLGAGALLLTERRLRTPTRNVPRGQRLA